MVSTATGKNHIYFRIIDGSHAVSIFIYNQNIQMTKLTLSVLDFIQFVMF